MKRDMELVRKILFEIEKTYMGELLNDLKINGYDYKNLIYHLEIMNEKGLLKDFEPIPSRGYGTVGFSLGGLSWSGQDYLDVIRNDEVWNKTIQTVEEKKLPKTVETIAKVAGIFVGNVIDQLND
jgi:hypothetical protein